MTVINIAMNLIKVAIQATTLASATKAAYLTQTGDSQAPYGSIIDKTLCYDRAL